MDFEKYIKKNHKQYADVPEADKIQCPECGAYCKSMDLHIRRVHKDEFTFAEFKEHYPDYPVFTSNRIKQLSKAAKENNPATGHGGTLSPYSKKFKNYQGEEARREVIERSARNRTSPTQIEYWLKVTGGDHEEAKRLLSERQNTTSIESMVRKYGAVEGFRMWEQRNQKWMDSLVERFGSVEALTDARFKHSISRSQGKDDFAKYRNEVERFTRLSVRLYPEQFKNIGRKENHVDHILSKKDGFLFGVEPYILGSICNLQALYYKENCSKRESSHMSVDDLYEKYRVYKACVMCDIYKEAVASL